MADGNLDLLDGVAEIRSGVTLDELFNLDALPPDVVAEVQRMAKEWRAGLVAPGCPSPPGRAWTRWRPTRPRPRACPWRLPRRSWLVVRWLRGSWSPGSSKRRRTALTCPRRLTGTDS
jgi:hypothetical protein